MAKSSFSSLFSTETTLNGFNFSNTAMAEALKKAAEAKTVKAAEQSAALLGDMDKHNNNLLAQLRNIRRQEKVTKEKLEEFKEAGQHFLDTGNFGPLYKFMPYEVQRVCAALGVDVPTLEEQKIPKS